MTRLLIPMICLLVACQKKVNQDSVTKVDSVKYPLLIDSGKRIVYEFGRMTNGKWEVYLDTIAYSKGELYRQDSIRHPLIQFGLTYAEWKTISCIISVDENDYWDKYMIGLIEKTGDLRIQYKNKKIYLSPTGVGKVKEGTWHGTFKNDSLEIQISGQLENKRISKHLTGYGNLVFRTPTQVKSENIFLVYEND